MSGFNMTKTCSKCGETKPLEGFAKDKTKKDGLSSLCKVCRTEYNKRYYKTNKEELDKKSSAYNKIWREKNKDRLSVQRKEYNERTREDRQLKGREYYKNNTKQCSARGKAYYARVKDDPDRKARKKEYDKAYRAAAGEERKEKIRAQSKARREAKKEHINAIHRAYMRERKKNDPGFRIRMSLGSRIPNLLKGKSRKPCSTIEALGCSRQELVEHLEAQFQAGMNWDNYGKHGWHVDHIIPLCTFDLTDEQQYKKACHYTNLQPLWAVDNLRKSGKIPEVYTNE